MIHIFPREYVVDVQQSWDDDGKSEVFVELEDNTQIHIPIVDVIILACEPEFTEIVASLYSRFSLRQYDFSGSFTEYTPS